MSSVGTVKVAATLVRRRAIANSRFDYPSAGLSPVMRLCLKRASTSGEDCGP
ncbi:hypothetical protein [Sphingomonas sp. SFZ2018-12]|uniref:hypothetical protein n=1 Tax=Sphingomonas sp. SFZ2018-12 TaxID=2683197 RepID=UPI001F0F2B5E|nr:hypothetical protein [Sphingomonas sp. SFZ2018-12]